MRSWSLLTRRTSKPSPSRDVTNVVIASRMRVSRPPAIDPASSCNPPLSRCSRAAWAADRSSALAIASVIRSPARSECFRHAGVEVERLEHLVGQPIRDDLLDRVTLHGGRDCRHELVRVQQRLMRPVAHHAAATAMPASTVRIQDAMDLVRPRGVGGGATADCRRPGWGVFAAGAAVVIAGASEVG